MPAPELEYWYRALASEQGIVVSCNDRENLRSKLYVARAEAKDPDLDCISIALSPTDDSHLWLVKRGQDAKR